jgi:hypothetical protein
MIVKSSQNQIYAKAPRLSQAGFSGNKLAKVEQAAENALPHLIYQVGSFLTYEHYSPSNSILEIICKKLIIDGAESFFNIAKNRTFKKNALSVKKQPLNYISYIQDGLNLIDKAIKNKKLSKETKLIEIPKNQQKLEPPVFVYDECV